MRLTVEIMTGTLFNIEVGNDATLADLKKEIVTQEKLPNDRLVLVVSYANQSRLLEEDGKSLSDYGVHDGSILYLLFNTLDDGSPNQTAFALPDLGLG